MTTPRKDLKDIEHGLQNEVPPPLHSMLDKESKDAAIEKYRSRQQKETMLCPPTCTGELLSNKQKKCYTQGTWVQLWMIAYSFQMKNYKTCVRPPTPLVADHNEKLQHAENVETPGRVTRGGHALRVEKARECLSKFEHGFYLIIHPVPHLNHHHHRILLIRSP